MVGTTLHFGSQLVGVVGIEDAALQLHAVGTGKAALVKDFAYSGKVDDALAEDGEVPVLEAAHGVFHVDATDVRHRLFRLLDRIHVFIVEIDVGGVVVDAHPGMVDSGHGRQHVIRILAQVRMGLHRQVDLVLAYSVANAAQAVVGFLPGHVAGLGTHEEIGRPQGGRVLGVAPEIPGEIVIINDDGIKSINAFPMHPRRAFCIFEYVYFSRPDSIITDRSVYGVRVNMGREMAKETAVEADIVVPVPDSGNCAALGYALETGLPYEMAFVRNHFVGRSFLQPSQLIRDFNVRVKLNLINELVAGKRVIIVDDSIVRGTTSRARVNNLKEAGAKEVHMRVSCPPHMNPCFYGIDFPDRKKLMAANHSIEEICDYLNADSVAYLSKEGMVKATGLPAENFCMACYDGDYPVAFDPTVDKHIMEQRRARVESIGEALAKEELQTRLL